MGAASGFLLPALTIGLGAGKILMPLFSAGSQISAAQAAAKAAAQAAQAQIKEYERQAAEIKEKTAMERSERVIQADKDFALLFTTALEGGGLGTVSLLRMAGELGQAAGRDIKKLNMAERDTLGALLNAAKASAAQAKGEQQQQGYVQKQIGLGAVSGLIGNTASVGKAISGLDIVKSIGV